MTTQQEIEVKLIEASTPHLFEEYLNVAVNEFKEGWSEWRVVGFNTDDGYVALLQRHDRRVIR